MVPLSPFFLNQRGPVRCLLFHKGFNAYSDEGLTNVIVFFKSELEDTKKRVEEKGHQKRKRPETGHVIHLCRFCKNATEAGLKQSTHRHVIHIHTHTCVIHIHTHV